MKTIPLICMLLVSCAGFEALDIVSYSPASGEYGIAREVAVRIEFSEDVRKDTVEQHFSLEADGSPVSGTHQWESNRIYRFVPNHPFENGVRCVMKLPKSIEDVRGNSMEKDFLSEFYIGNDLVSPKIVSSIPAYSEGGTYGISVDLPRIEIRFSEPMDTMATSSAFSISPDIAGYIQWSDDHTRLSYHLLSKLEHGTQYRVSVAATACDAAGNPLAQPFILVFIAGEDITHPAVRGVYESGSIPPPYFAAESVNQDISRFSSICIEFSEPMDARSVETAFSMSPSVSGRFRWTGGNTVVTFTPETAFAMDTVYTLTIGASAKDASGLSLREAYSVLFKTNAADSLPFTISAIEGSYEKETQDFILLYDGTALPWPVFIEMGPNNGQSNPNDYIMKFYFSNEKRPVAVNLYSLIESMLIEGEGSPCITDIELADDGTAAVVTLDGLVNTDNPATPDSVLYRLTIAGGTSGVKDAHGNTMRKSFVFEFKDN
jgi:hypothetical protein